MYKIEDNNVNDYAEVRIALDELNGNSQSFQNSLSYSYGILSFYTNSFASIKPSFFSFNFVEKKEYLHSELVIFTPSEASIVGIDDRIKTTENLYLVRYMDGGQTINPKTGEMQPTIEKAVPVEILMTCPKKQCEYLYVEGGFVVWKMCPRSVPQHPVSISGSIEKTALDALTDLDDASISALTDIVMADIELRGFSYSSQFPEYLGKICGTKDITHYAANVKGFIEKYLSASLRYEPHYTYEGKQIPGVILPQKPIEYRNQAAVFYALYAEELDKKYEASQYVEFLSANCFRCLTPDRIPVKYIEKALTAARRLIFGFSETEVVLNHFQKCLIQAPTNDSYSAWYLNTEYDNGIMEQCSSTILPHLEKQSIPRILNELIHTDSRAERYLPSLKGKTKGIVARFQIAKNEQTIPMYIVAAFAQNSSSSLTTLIVHLCEFIKDYYNTILPSEQRFDDTESKTNLSDVLRVILTAPCAQELTLTKNAKTLLLSTFLDTRSLYTLDDDLARNLFNDNGIQLDLIDLIRHHEKWSRERFVELINNLKPHLQILERAVAMIWGDLDLQYDINDCEIQVLPTSLLKLLAWLITYCDAATLEAVIDLPSFHGSIKYKRRTKYVSLLRALPEIQHLTESDSSVYNLGAYLSGKVYREIEEYDIAEITTINITDAVSDWNRFAKHHFNLAISSLESSPLEHKELYAALFRDYWQDNDRETILQKKYTAELQKDVGTVAIPENTKTILSECYGIKAFDAYVKFFQRFIEDGSVDVSDDLFDSFVNACNQRHKYQELIEFLIKHPEIEQERQEVHLINVINASFAANQYSPAAFSIFSSGFSVENAINLILTHFATTKFESITSLIALYLYQGEYFKARYLYDIYGARAKVGRTRIYAQFNKLLDSNTNHVLQVGNEVNHFQVINTAFYALNPQDLIEFLSWAGTVPLPAWKDYNPKHNYKGAFLKLLDQPKDADRWENFLFKLSSKLSQFPANAWMICVCDGILSSIWNLTNNYDAHRAYEIVLTQIRNPITKRRFFPVNLLPYITEYIVRNDDTRLCENLLSTLGEDQLLSRITTQNIWEKSYKESLTGFSAYCIRKIKETDNKLFSDILKIVSPSISVENLAAVAAIPGNEEYLIRQLSKCYLNGSQISEAQLLVKQINRSSLTFKATEALSVLQFAYTDETELFDKFPMLEREESIFRLKKDCVTLLQNYPSDEDFRVFEKSDADPQYKRLVFSIVFGVYYSDSIFDRYDYDFKAFQRKTGQIIITRFLDKAFRSQLVFNKSYEFFYIRWRYLKLYAASVIALEGPKDLADLIELMKLHHHEDAVLDQYLVPFKNAVDALWLDSKLDEAEKKNFLYSLITGEFSDFFDEHLDSFASLSSDTARSMRAIVSALDYRDVAKSIYCYFVGEMRRSQFKNILSVTNVLVPTAFDTVCALQQFHNDDYAWNYFEKSLLIGAGKCVDELVTMKADDFAKYHDLVNPLTCSRQFPFQMYKIIRSYLVQGESKSFLKGKSFLRRSGTLIAYLAEHCDVNAPDVFHYLEALEAAISGNRAETANCLYAIAGRIDSIPVSWRGEASALQDYATGSTDVFHASSNSLDLSIDAQNSGSTYFFGHTILDSLGVQEQQLSSNETDELWNQFLFNRDTMPEKDTLIAGATALCNYNRYSKEEKLREKAFHVGLFAIKIKSSASLSSDIKVDIAAELFSHKCGGQEFFSLFDSLLKESDCSINSWCRNRDRIRHFISDSGYYSRYFSDEVFAQLYSDILDPCNNSLELLDAQQYSVEELRKDLISFKSIIDKMPTTPICKTLYAALDQKKAYIERHIRLKIKIENPKDVTTDGYLYFNIRNIGDIAVPMDYCVLELQKQTIHLGESIKTLLPGYETGARAQYTFVPDEPVIVLVRYNGEILDRACRECNSIQIRLPQQEIDLMDEVYNVRQAARVYGRSFELTKLNRLISTEGKALIYGPSRIGKTSILDGVRNPSEIVEDETQSVKKKKRAINRVDRDRLIIITFGGEGIGKDSDYEAIPNDAASETIEEHLLVSSILFALEDHDRMLLPQLYSAELQEGIRNCLTENNKISVRYSHLREYLQKQGFELWLILDEFQKIVERWVPSEQGEFNKVWERLNSQSRIKLILCGSDDLLKHMVLKSSSYWREKMSPYGIQIFALEEAPFRNMLKTEPLSYGESVEELGISYSEEALHALYIYTGGVPLFGKQICNQVLKALESSKELKHRSVIFSADVARATQLLIDQQSAKYGNIKEINDSVTKNLAETDKWILNYIAKYMDQNGTLGCPYSVFYNHPSGPLKIAENESESVKALDVSLKIASARGIIKKIDDDATDPVFTFCTVFYYSAFLGSAKDDLHLENRLFGQAETENEENEEPEFSREHVADEIKIRYNDPAGQYSFLKDILVRLDPDGKQLRPLFEQDYSKNNVNISGGTTAFGDNNTLNNITIQQVQINQISGSVSGLLKILSDSGRMLSATQQSNVEKILDQMPRLSLLPFGTETPDKMGVEDDSLSVFDVDSYTEAWEKGVAAASNQSMVDWAKNHVKQLPLSEDALEFICDIRENDNVPSNKFRQADRDRVLTSLYLWDIYKQIEEKTVKPVNNSSAEKPFYLDYSPVTILLGKTLEQMLIEKHLPLYRNQDIWKHQVCLDANAKNPPANKPLRFDKPVIGTFTTALHILLSISMNDCEEEEKRENRRRFLQKTAASESEWKKYYDDLNAAKDIRNNSAHLQPVLQSECDALFKKLFDQKLLKHTYEYVSAPKTDS